MFLDELKSMVESNEGYKLVTHVCTQMHIHTTFYLLVYLYNCYFIKVRFW